MRNLYNSKLKKSDSPVTYAICPCKGSCFLSCSGKCNTSCSGTCAGDCHKTGGSTVIG